MARELISRSCFSIRKKSEQMIVHRFLVLAVSFTVALSFSSENHGIDYQNESTWNITANEDSCVNSVSIINSLSGVEDKDDTRHKLYLVLMAPFPAEDSGKNPSWVAGHIVGPAVQLALDQINRRSDILTDYKLVMIAIDTFCSRGYNAWKAILDVLLSDKQIVGIVGPGCSGATIDIAEQVRQPGYSLIAITPSATTPNLEKPKYKNTFATISSSTAYVKVYKELMDYNGWDAVSVLYDEKRSYFLDTFRKFHDNVDRNRIAYQSPVSDGKDEKFFPFSDIIEMDRGRVILSFAAGSTAKTMMCLAFNYGMVYPTYQWVFHDRTIAQLHKQVSFVYDGKNYNCSADDMARAIHGILLVRYEIALEDREVITPTGQTFREFSTSYREVLCDVKEGDSTLNYGNTNYDAAWALAHALNRTAARIDLTSYGYGQPNITEEIRNDLYTVHFTGASGPILFDKETRSTITDIDVFQVNATATDNIDLIKVAHYKGTLNILSNDSSAFISDTFVNIPVHIHPALGVIVILIALVLLGITGTLHIANTIWYSYRSIKATSPNISHLIFGGCYLFAVAIIIYSAQQTFQCSETVYSVMCNTFRWCFVLGYTLIFGTVLAKVWRVYRLFKHFRNKSPGCLVTDNALVVFVILLLFVDVCICTIWDAIDPFTRSDSVEARVEINKIPSLLIRSECTCTLFIWWISVIGTYKGAIALLLVAFSILNRKIRRRDFQHTKKINILIYSLTMMGGVLFPIFFLLQNSDIHISFIILSFMLSIAISMSCLTLFLTPVGQVIKIKMGLAEDATFTGEFKRRVSTVSVLSFFNSEDT